MYKAEIGILNTALLRKFYRLLSGAYNSKTFSRFLIRQMKVPDAHHYGYLIISYERIGSDNAD